LGARSQEEYNQALHVFSAEDFNAREWARMVKSAGANYACLTTRHHDGFSLYDTRGLSDFDVMHSPANRDLVGEFVHACREEGISPFLYHTTLDWRWGSDTCSAEAFKDYQQYLRSSVEILCRSYGEVGGFWFDGNWSREDVDWEEDALYSMIRQYQPNAIITNNSGLHALGAAGHGLLDTRTFEQSLPGERPIEGQLSNQDMTQPVPEMCQTLNSHWGISENDYSYISVPEVLKTFCTCRKHQANYLLNIGPDARGAIGGYEQSILSICGRWIHRFGQALFEGTASDIFCSGSDFCLHNQGEIYWYVFDLQLKGDDHVVAEGSAQHQRVLKNCPSLANAVWLDNGEPIPFEQQDDGSVLLEATPFPYGTQLVIRVGVLSPS
jgi:alpha-L-fucosidase